MIKFCSHTLLWAAVCYFSPLHAVPYAFITNQGADPVSAIDTGSDEIVKTLRVGSKLVGVAVTADGARCFVSNPERMK